MAESALHHHRLAMRLVIGVSMFAISGCTTHLLFVESSHLGFKAKFKAESPTPAEIDLGWNRRVTAMIPKQLPSEKRGAPAAGSSEGQGGNSKGAERPLRDEGSRPGSGRAAPAGAPPATILIEPDPKELMSLYSTYDANVGFADPIRVRHFLATGMAANNLMADSAQLEALTRNLAADRASKDAKAKGNPLGKPAGDSNPGAAGADRQ